MKMQTIQKKEIILPESGAKCYIALDYGDICDIEGALFGAVDMEVGENVKQKINAAALMKEKEMILSKGLREWEFEDDNGPLAITYENIKKLSRIDGDFLHAEIRKLYEVKTSSSDKKK